MRHCILKGGGYTGLPTSYSQVALIKCLSWLDARQFFSQLQHHSRLGIQTMWQVSPKLFSSSKKERCLYAKVCLAFLKDLYEFIPKSLEMMPFVLDWILMHRKWGIPCISGHKGIHTRLSPKNCLPPAFKRQSPARLALLDQWIARSRAIFSEYQNQNKQFLKPKGSRFRLSSLKYTRLQIHSFYNFHENIFAWRQKRSCRSVIFILGKTTCLLIKMHDNLKFLF